MAPDQECLVFLGNNDFNLFLAIESFRRILRQEYVTHGIVSRCWQFDAQLARHSAKETMGQGGKHASAIAGVFFKPAAATMIHARIDMMCVEHDLMTRLALDIGDKTYTARVFFLRRVIEPILFRVTAWLYNHFLIHLYLLFILTRGCPRVGNQSGQPVRLHRTSQQGSNDSS